VGITDGCVNGEVDQKIKSCECRELAKNMTRKAPGVGEELRVHTLEGGSSFAPIRAISIVVGLPVLEDKGVRFEGELLLDRQNEADSHVAPCFGHRIQ